MCWVKVLFALFQCCFLYQQSPEYCLDFGIVIFMKRFVKSSPSSDWFNKELMACSRVGEKRWDIQEEMDSGKESGGWGLEGNLKGGRNRCQG